MPLSIVVGSLASAAVYAISVQNGKRDTSWLIGSGILALIIPQTVIFIGPINNRVRNEEIEDDNAPDELGRWQFHHLIRTAATIGLFAFYTYKLARN